MGKDIHEVRRLNDKPDVNPNTRRPNNWDPGRVTRRSRIIEWRKRRSRAMYKYTQQYLGGHK